MNADPLTQLRALPREALVPAGWVLDLLGREAVADSDGPDLGLTVQEVAQLTGRAPSTVRVWAGSGRLPGAYRLQGREWRIPRSALRALAEGGGAAESGPDLKPPPGGLRAWREVAGRGSESDGRSMAP